MKKNINDIEELSDQYEEYKDKKLWCREMVRLIDKIEKAEKV